MGRMVYVRDHYINTDDINIIDVNNDGTGTVSYTHLDVYKRQL